MYSENELKKLHETELDILSFVHSICLANNIKYFIIAGTLLGCIRHKGFIPWDDDIDIGMMRDDYEKFLDIMRNNNNPDFSIGHFSNNKQYPQYFAKVYKEKTIFMEKCNRNKKIKHSIYIDIMPFDYLPNNEEERLKALKKQNRAIRFLALKCYIKTYRYKPLVNVFASFIRFLLYIFFIFIPKKKVFEICNKKLVSKEKTMYIGSQGKNGFVVPADAVFDLKYGKFENMDVYLPNKPEVCLTKMYGDDYMVIPPVEKRIQHRPIKLDFND